MIMREFIKNGKLHWSLQDEAPCKTHPITDNMWNSVMSYFDRRENDANHPIDWCQVCFETKWEYFKLLKNGGTIGRSEDGAWEIAGFDR